MSELVWIMVAALAAGAGAALTLAFARRSLQRGVDARIAETTRDLELRHAQNLERVQAGFKQADADRVQLRAETAAQAAELDKLRAHLVGTYDEMDRLRALAAISRDAKPLDTGHAYAATMPMDLPQR